jgi:hypothetical protein
MTAVSRHLGAFAFVPSHSTCWFSTSTVLDILEFFRSHFFQEKWASVVVNRLLENITPFAGGWTGYRKEPMGSLFSRSPGVRHSSPLTRGFTPPSRCGCVCLEHGTSVFSWQTGQEAYWLALLA